MSISNLLLLFIHIAQHLPAVFSLLPVPQKLSKMSKPRPGVEAAVRLSKISDVSTWTTIESQYTDMLLQKNDEKLMNLDQQCEALARRWQTSEDGAYCTCDELYTVVDWKFAKGKARPMLWKQIRSNSEESVRDASRRAFQSLENVLIHHNEDRLNKALRQALDLFSVLKGIGPATSSAFLSLYRPDLFAFMDDEVLECFIGQRKYTVPAYFQLNDECRVRAKALGEGWTARRVGNGLWSAARLSLCANRNDLTLDCSNCKEQEDLPDAVDPKSKNPASNGQNKKLVTKRDEEQADNSEDSIASRMAKRNRRA